MRERKNLLRYYQALLSFKSEREREREREERERKRESKRGEMRER